MWSHEVCDQLNKSSHDFHKLFDMKRWKFQSVSLLGGVRHSRLYDLTDAETINTIQISQTHDHAKSNTVASMQSKQKKAFVLSNGIRSDKYKINKYKN